MSNAGEAIRNMRKDAGMTQQKLSEASGVSRAHIAAIEIGIYSPTAKTIEKIARACNKSIKDFL